MNDPGAIPFSQPPPAEPDSRIAEESETYRREVGRLLAEGHEGRFAVIKAGRVVGLFDTCEERGPSPPAGSFWSRTDPASPPRGTAALSRPVQAMPHLTRRVSPKGGSSRW